MAYLLDGTLFSGDIGGVRLAGPPYVMLPMPPPEFHLEQWRQSFDKIRGLPVERIAATHFGIYHEVERHWQLLGETLQAVEGWIEATMPDGPTLEELRRLLPRWFKERAEAHGLAGRISNAHEVANPAWMSAAGILRYWNKFRAN
jgi:glyoxylase-like metal-dependent hydrolase (beta-lactamase superfamily II)